MNIGNTLRLTIRALLIGFVLALAFESAFLFVPLPDAAYETLTYLMPGILWQLTPWTDHQMTASSLFLTNALVYAALALAVLAVRRRRAL